MVRSFFIQVCDICINYPWITDIHYFTEQCQRSRGSLTRIKKSRIMENKIQSEKDIVKENEALSGEEDEKQNTAEVKTSQNKRKRKTQLNSVSEKYERDKINFLEKFQDYVENDFDGREIIVVAPAAGQSDAKTNNTTILMNLSKIVKEKNEFAKKMYFNCQFNLEGLRHDEFGFGREGKFDFIIYNLLTTKTSYKAVFKNIQEIFRFTKKLILFLPNKIPDFLEKNCGDDYLCQHFVLVRNCVLESIYPKESAETKKKKGILKRQIDDTDGGQSKMVKFDLD